MNVGDLDCGYEADALGIAPESQKRAFSGLQFVAYRGDG
jgi:hypothetical protein